MSPKVLKAIQKDARKSVQNLAEQFGLEAIPANVETCLEDILKDPDPTKKAGDALRKMEIGCLAAWSRGTVAGPDSPESLERRAKAAEGLAKMFAGKDDPKGAEKQLKRAEAFRKQAAALQAVPKEEKKQ